MVTHSVQPDYYGWAALLARGELPEDAAAAFTDWLTERNYQEFQPGEPLYFLYVLYEVADGYWCVNAGSKWVITQYEGGLPSRVRRHLVVTDKAFATEFRVTYRECMEKYRQTRRLHVPDNLGDSYNFGATAGLKDAVVYLINDKPLD